MTPLSASGGTLAVSLAERRKTAEMKQMVKFIDEFDNEISQEEIIEKTSYKELHFDETNILKLHIEFDKGKIDFIKYYKIDKENENEVIKNLLFKCSRFSIISQQKFENYIIENENEYINGILHFKLRSLINYKGEGICWEEIDLISGLPDYEKTKKYLYKNSEKIIEASYYKYGNLEHITYRPFGKDYWGQDERTYDQSDFQELQNLVEEDLSYYLNSKLEPNNER